MPTRMVARRRRLACTFDVCGSATSKESNSERGIAWRAADSLGLRHFLQIGWDKNTPDHPTISRTRRLIGMETHRKVFGWVLGLLADTTFARRWWGGSR